MENILQKKVKIVDLYKNNIIIAPRTDAKAVIVNNSERLDHTISDINDELALNRHSYDEKSESLVIGVPILDRIRTIPYKSEYDLTDEKVVNSMYIENYQYCGNYTNVKGPIILNTLNAKIIRIEFNQSFYGIILKVGNFEYTINSNNITFSISKLDYTELQFSNYIQITNIKLLN